MKSYWYLTAVFLILVGVIAGCSGGDNPVVPVSAVNAEGDSGGGSARVLWGVYDLVIDAATGDMEIVPDRNSQFTCNVVNFLQPPIAPIHLITRELVTNESNIPAGYYVFDITLHHPFPGTKFCGFDVMGIIMSKFTAHEFQSDPALAVELPPSNLLKNPDGYTRWWNPSEFTTYDKLFGYINGKLALGNFNCNHTLNPFKYFSDDTEADEFFDPDPEMRGFFSSSEPGVNTRRYRLQFDMSSGAPAFELKYAISANYAGPAVPEPPYTPDSYPVSANMQEAYRIEYMDNGSSAFYVNDTTYGGDLDFYIEVRDWQLDGTLSSVMHEIGGVTVESPTLFDEPVDLDITQFVEVPSNHTVVRIPGHIDNVTPASTHNQLILITVRSAEPSTYEPQVPGITGFEYPDAPLAGYNIIAVPISDQQPSAEIPEVIAQGYFTGNACLQINSLGYPEIFFKRYPDNGLGYARFDGASWDVYSDDFEILYAEGLSLDQYDHPHIVYGGAGDSSTSYATNDGSGWEHTEVYSLCWPGTDSSLALDSMGLPHLAIHGGGGGGQGVWHYWFDSDVWNSEHPTDNHQLIGPNIKIDSDDHVHIFTHEMYGIEMRHYYQTDSGWTNEIIDTDGNGGNMQDAEFDSPGNIHMAYSIGAGGYPTNQLGYTVRTDAGWSDETVVDAVGDLRQSSLVLDSNDLPHIAYIDRQTHYLKYAHFNGTSWQCSVIVDDCYVEGRTSIQMLPGDVPIIAYNDWNNHLVKCIVLD